MVTIINYKKSETKDGKEFFGLELQGGAEAVQSQKTNRFYMTARTCLIPSTFDEQTCKRLVGTTIPGTILKMPSDPYEYSMKETNEVVTLNHRWEYQPVEMTTNLKDDLFIPQHLVMG